MPGILVSDMIQRASTQADMVDGFVDEPEWLSWLQQESIALEILLARNGWTQDILFDTQTATGNNSFSIANGADILAVVGVWELVNNRYRRLTLRSPIEFYGQPDGAGGGISGPGAYYSVKAPQNGVAGGGGYTLNIFPRPLSGTYVIAYLPPPFPDGGAPQLTDTVYYPLGFEEWIVLRMARRALIKEESSTEGVEKLLRDEEQKIEEACWERTLAETPSVRNVDRAQRGWLDWMNFPPPIGWYWA